MEDRSQSPVEAHDDMPACQSCRKRKLKCSRELPSCSQCARLSCECVYGGKKLKPGLRSGAVENLNRRIETLERLLLNSQSHGRVIQAPPPSATDTHGCIYHAALLIANQFNGSSSPNSLSDRTACRSSDSLGHTHQQPFQQGLNDEAPRTLNNSRKRKFQDTTESDSPAWDRLDECVSFLPNANVMPDIINAYFSKVHHWMPFVQQRRFRERLHDPTETNRLGLLLHAITVAAIRQVDSEDFPLDHEAIEHQIRVSRNIVLLNAMNSLSIENLQALALIAFDRMGSANIPRAWAIVGSLVKSVEYLQLTVEPDEQPRHLFMRPLTLLHPAQGPGELEERRRVFWNIFLLDRFLSVTTGWNPSLTAQDVHRRLPSNGKMWNSNERVATPYFGILDRSTAKLGSMMSYIGPKTGTNGDINTQALSPGSVKLEEAVNVGAVAFRIEATESLSQVTSFFLQQEFNFRNRDEVGKWLARFKELDLRLVHWKLFFPERWNDSSVSKEQTPIEMDPNLTLAHLTHNTSMVLLHQHIAYPTSDLTKHVKLPSSCSAETCQLAAVENASIIAKFLSHISYFVPAQFAFCAFISARILLVHWRFYNTDLNSEFANLVNYLRDMSRRWQGLKMRLDDSDEDLDIAARYASELQSLHDKCLHDPGFCTEILLHPFTAANPDTDPLAIRHPDTGLFIGRDVDHHSPLSNELHSPSVSSTPRYHRNMRRSTRVSDDSKTRNEMPANEVNSTYGTTLRPQLDASGAAVPSGNWEDELAEMSNTLFDQQFAEMDRVFTLEGTDFRFDMGGWDSISN